VRLSVRFRCLRGRVRVGRSDARGGAGACATARPRSQTKGRARRGGKNLLPRSIGAYDPHLEPRVSAADLSVRMAEIEVLVVPRARRDESGGEPGGRLFIPVTAPPVGGAANTALCRLIARRAGVPARRVSIVRGQTSRDKVVRLEGLTEAATSPPSAGSGPCEALQLTPWSRTCLPWRVGSKAQAAARRRARISGRRARRGPAARGS
jgi:uncharacterized protein